MLREERMINMKIALIAHDRKKPLMIKLTTAIRQSWKNMNYSQLGQQVVKSPKQLA